MADRIVNPCDYPDAETWAEEAYGIVSNVRDGRYGCICSFEVEPLVYAKLGPEHVGRTVVYRDHGRAEAGTITSWRDGTVFARYSRGETAAGARPENLSLVIRSL